MLLRITNMRGVDLGVFDFDYDLTWAAFFMNGREKIYGRFGGRDAGSADSYLTLGGLKHSLRQALAAYRQDPQAQPAARPSRTVEQFPAAQKLKAERCIHCHQVYDFRREEKLAAGTWQRRDIWVYPLPQNLGMVLDPERGDRIRSITPGSPADQVGLRAGDVLKTVQEMAVASFADVQYALHLAPENGPVLLTWLRDRVEHSGKLQPPNDWRETDISWRASMWGLAPAPGVYGQDLSAREKKSLGLGEKALAFRQGDFVPGISKRAGIRAGDIIVGIDDRKLEMSMLQFNAYVRLHYKVGDRIMLRILREGKRLEVPMTLGKGEN